MSFFLAERQRATSSQHKYPIPHLLKTESVHLRADSMQTKEPGVPMDHKATADEHPAGAFPLQMLDMAALSSLTRTLHACSEQARTVIEPMYPVVLRRICAGVP